MTWKKGDAVGGKRCAEVECENTPVLWLVRFLEAVARARSDAIVDHEEIGAPDLGRVVRPHARLPLGHEVARRATHVHPAQRRDDVVLLGETAGLDKSARQIHSGLDQTLRSPAQTALAHHPGADRRRWTPRCE